MIQQPTPNSDFDKYDEERLHMEELLSSSLLEFDIPMRVAIPLEAAGIRKLKDLVSLNRDELLQINRIGVNAADDLERMLARYDLSLGMIKNQGCQN